MMFRLLCLAVGYICGLFNTSIVVGKITGVDIRKRGSGNTGTANTLRTLGFKAGVVVLLGDMLKATIPMLVMLQLMKTRRPDDLLLVAVYTGLGAIMGHNYPVYTGFKGGKGIATSFGVALVLDWRIAVPGFLLFIAVFLIRHYMSMGSMVATTVAFLALLAEGAVYGQVGTLLMMSHEQVEYYTFCLLVIALALFRHRTNIVRLIKGEERQTHLHHDRNKVE